MEWMQVENCNLCGSRQRIIVADKDRYGFQVRVAVCQGCGLGYLVDRLSKAGYAEFYDRFYRHLIEAWSGRQLNLQTLQRDTAQYAAKVCKRLQHDLELPDGLAMLDVGGGTGMVALEFKRRYGAQATVLDPSSDELAIARSEGLSTIYGLLEDAELPSQTFDLITVCRTAEHFFDLRLALAKVRELLRPGGYFYFDYLDFVEHSRLDGCPETTARLDHCYYFYHDMVPVVARHVGFEVQASYFSDRLGLVGHLLRPAETQPETISPEVLNPLVRVLLEHNTDWQILRQTKVSSFQYRGAQRAKRVARRIIDSVSRWRSGGDRHQG
jgi:ubiquinone/menaquinone biosynthesis C-methylase UbiE